MSDYEYRKIFSDNLKRCMSHAGKTQIDIIKDLGFNKSSVSAWYNGTRLPRPDAIKTLAKYLGVKDSDLREEYQVLDELYWLSPLENEIIKRYRDLSETEQNMILRMLGIEEKRDTKNVC